MKNLAKTNIFQVQLLSCAPGLFSHNVEHLIKKIVCLDIEKCNLRQQCNNCYELQKNNYLGLYWKKLSSTNLLKKTEITNIINNFALTAINNLPKVLVLEQIEYSTKEACNVMLKFLEELPQNCYVILATTNLNMVLPTIRSRSILVTADQLNFFDKSAISKLTTQSYSDFLLLMKEYFKNIDIDYNELEISKTLSYVKKIIFNINNKDTLSNFLLIDYLITLKEKIVLFFQIFQVVIEKKLLELNKIKISSKFFSEKNILGLAKNFKISNQQILLSFMELVISTYSSISYKTNLNLLLNYFFINVNQGIENNDRIQNT